LNHKKDWRIEREIALGQMDILDRSSILVGGKKNCSKKSLDTHPSIQEFGMARGHTQFQPKLSSFKNWWNVDSSIDPSFEDCGVSLLLCQQ
jgi:hypothetical protein